jgi:hypothetical protein
VGVLYQLKISSRVNWGKREGLTYSETKFVRRDEDDDSPVLRRSSVPPTICLTFPSCRSIQGLNWDFLRGASVVVVGDMVYKGQEEMVDGRLGSRWTLRMELRNEISARD